MAEQHLRDAAIPLEQWPGRRFRWAENVDGVWRSVIVEVERRGDDWVVVRLDRKPERLPDAELGFSAV